MSNLVKCPSCNHDVSRNASKCPNCGEPLKEECWIVHDGSIGTILLIGIMNAYGHVKVNPKLAGLIIYWIVAVFPTVIMASSRDISDWCDNYRNAGLYAFWISLVFAVLLTAIPFSRGKWYNYMAYAIPSIPLAVWFISASSFMFF